ncbi:hypothetical protein V6N13_087245 [Hibiscus sabdariffa]
MCWIRMGCYWDLMPNLVDVKEDQCGAELLVFILQTELDTCIQFRLVMGALAIDAESLDSDVYLYHDLAAIGTPRILTLVCSFLEKSVKENVMLSDAANCKDKVAVTVVHGLRVPTISIRQYIDRMFKYAQCSPSCFLVAYIYLDRFGQQTDLHLTSFNVHRLLLTSVMVAAKFMDDLYFNNAYYARVGGVSTAELNSLEMEFLFSLDFRLQVSINTFERYCSQLQKESAEGHQVERPIQDRGIEECLSIGNFE